MTILNTEQVLITIKDNLECFSMSAEDRGRVENAEWRAVDNGSLISSDNQLMITVDKVCAVPREKSEYGWECTTKISLRVIDLEKDKTIATTTITK